MNVGGLFKASIDDELLTAMIDVPDNAVAPAAHRLAGSSDICRQYEPVTFAPGTLDGCRLWINGLEQPGILIDTTTGDLGGHDDTTTRRST